MKTALLTAAVLGAALAARAEGGAKREFPLDGIKSLRIQTESGPIEVRAGEKLEVETTANAKPELCVVTLETKDGALLLKAETPKRWFGSGEGCGAGFRVSAPSVLALDAKTGSGGMTVSGRAGALHLSAGSGDIVLEKASGEAALAAGSGKIYGTLSGRLTAKLGSGGLTLTGLTGDADVKTGSGDVMLVWEKARAERVAVKSGSGNVHLVFPTGTKLHASQVTGSGTAVNKLGETPDAALKITVITGSGDSTIETGN